ncbi:MFS general substrate transporter [Mollisia scopiformis]|uniref:MFS general substrate transporter n=1 Tax=Mollisia scopiformis TaxID=149040 RepID=A0A194X9W8_MOLSC|nr:MFS general substrate transporter [Mollisia scopiformis]KUJ16924.1 MFS general substrate transporter [Mollisia scopiformis]
MWWRVLILLNISFYNMMGNVFAAGISPLFGLVIKEFHCSVDQASRLASYALLMLGLSNLLALPTVEYLGKRYTILMSMAVFLASNIWAAKAESYNSLVGSRFVGGFAGGVIEALGPFIVSECFHEHQLARAMVVYVGFLAAGSAVGPIVAGGIASGLNNWRWFFGISAIAIGTNLVTCVLLLPETTHITDDYALEATVSSLEEEKDAATCIENGIERGDPASTEQTQSLKSIWIERSFFTRLAYAKKRENPVKLFFQPFPLLLAPPVFFTTLVFGLTIGWTALISIVVSNVYSAPPHLWQAWQIGLLNFGPLVGLLIGLPLGGMMADMLSKAALKRSDGEHDPRARLPAVILGALISPAGLLAIGFALQRNLHWIIVAVGSGMLAFGLTASANVLLTYSVDCFRMHAGHVGVLINVVKNSLAFGVSFGSMSWYYESGPARQFGTMAGLLWFAYLCIIPVYIYSRSLIRQSERLLHV